MTVLRRVLFLVALLAAGVLLKQAFAQGPRARKQLALPGVQVQVPAAGASPTQPPATVVGPMVQATATPQTRRLYEPRTLTLDWPRRLYQGDSDWVRLDLTVDDQGRLTPTVARPGREVRVTPVPVPDLYETHLLILQARLDAAGLHVAPSGPLTETLTPGRPVTFLWTVRGEEPGRYQAVLTLQLRLEPKAGGPVKTLSLAQEVLPLEVVNFLGLSGFWVRMLGTLSGLLSLVLVIPDLLDLWERLRGRARR